MDKSRTTNDYMKAIRTRIDNIYKTHVYEHEASDIVTTYLINISQDGLITTDEYFELSEYNRLKRAEVRKEKWEKHQAQLNRIMKESKS